MRVRVTELVLLRVADLVGVLAHLVRVGLGLGCRATAGARVRARVRVSG